MPIECPKCGSRFLRESQPRDSRESIARWWFVSPIRCLDCKTRFVARTLILKDMIHARCPQCLRMDLGVWTGKTYEPPFWMALKTSFGANRWRCEYCRMNFASFRKRKEVFTFKRWRNMNSGAAVAEGRARLAEAEARAEEARQVANAEAARAAALEEARMAEEDRQEQD